MKMCRINLKKYEVESLIKDLAMELRIAQIVAGVALLASFIAVILVFIYVVA